MALLAVLPEHPRRERKWFRDQSPVPVKGVCLGDWQSISGSGRACSEVQKRAAGIRSPGFYPQAGMALCNPGDSLPDLWQVTSLLFASVSLSMKSDVLLHRHTERLNLPVCSQVFG